jgi:hypothetical protein
MVDHAIRKAERTGAVDAKTHPTIIFDVAGVPPIKNEARSLFAATMASASGFERLLTAAVAAAQRVGWTSVRDEVELDVTVRSPTQRPPGDATNFLGGIADVLQGRKTAQGMDLSHLGKLAGIALFDDDSQVQEIPYRAIADSIPSYTVQGDTPVVHESGDRGRQCGSRLDCPTPGKQHIKFRLPIRI